VTLLVVQRDATYRPLKRRGRFAIDFACLSSEAHVEAATREALPKFVGQMEREGFEYVPSLLTLAPDEAVKRAVRNFLRRVTETGRRLYDDEHEDTDAQILPHLPVVQNFTPDPGKIPVPPPPRDPTPEMLRNYARVCDAIAAVERGRIAQDVAPMRDQVDIRVRLPFRQRLAGKALALPASLRRVA
jgi:hypothetical protein